MKEVLNRFGLSDGRLLGITTDNASSNYSMTRSLQQTLEIEGIEWSAPQHHISCMAHVIQLSLGAFMKMMGVKGRTKAWEVAERDTHFGENDSAVTSSAQRLRSIGNARVRNVASLKPGLAKIIEKVFFRNISQLCMISN